jgi:cyclic-di-GMP phosphodiesterase TipF (flagellum assembly factor)
VQGLVYIVIALAAAGVAAAAYFGLTFSVIEAVVTAAPFGAIAVVLTERRLRRRAEARLERAIEDLARLLSTDAQAGHVLSQRVNAMADADAGSRLDAIEADISVLGTVVRQVAEAMAELDEARRAEAAAAAPATAATLPPDEDAFPEPEISAEELRRALDANRLVFHIEPVIALPQRRPQAYDLVPRLLREEGGLADAPDFMPRRHGEALIRRIEALALEEAVVIARRARTAGQPVRLVLPLTLATIADKRGVDELLATLGANQAIAAALGFAIPHSDWRALSTGDRRPLMAIRDDGAGFVLRDAASLRFDFAELQGFGFTTVCFDASRFLARPEAFTDFHTADIAPYARRFEIELCATGVIDEQQLLSLFEDSITLAQGPHVGRPGPVRSDLRVERDATLPRRAEA